MNLTSKSSVVTNNSFLATYDLSVGFIFWFCPSFASYYNVYLTSKSSVATNDLPEDEKAKTTMGANQK